MKDRVAPDPTRLRSYLPWLGWIAAGVIAMTVSSVVVGLLALALGAAGMAILLARLGLQIHSNRRRG